MATVYTVPMVRLGHKGFDELRAAGYLESTIGQYAKTIKALSGYAGPMPSTWLAGAGLPRRAAPPGRS